MKSVPATLEVTQTATDTPSSNSEFRRMKALEEFLKLKPPLFDGQCDPLAAASWLNSIKTMFNSIGVSQEYLVGFATYLFEGSAEEWWDLRGSLGDVGNVRWKKFMAMFKKTYVSGSLNQDMIARFHNLKQKDSTVAEYHALFAELCRYDPVTAADPAAKCARFRRGLRSGIRSRVAPFTFIGFDELLIVAQRVEADCKDTDRKRKRDLDSDECFLCGSVGDKTCGCPSRQAENATVEQYHAGFVEHFRSSDPITALDRAWMCIKFKEGLSPNIKSKLETVTFQDFDTLVKVARRAEAALGRNNKEKSPGEDPTKKKRKRKRKKKKKKQSQD